MEVETDKIEVEIKEEVWKKCRILTNDNQDEWGGWLGGEVIDGKMILDDLMIPEQEVTSAEVDIKPEDIRGMLKEYKHKRVKRILCHIHSHNSMSAFFSATDTTNMENIMRDRDFFVFIVVSQQTDKPYLAELWLSKPFEVKINVEIKIGYNDNLKKWCEKEWKKKIKTKVIEVTTAGYDDSMGDTSLDHYYYYYEIEKEMFISTDYVKKVRKYLKKHHLEFVEESIGTSNASWFTVKAENKKEADIIAGKLEDYVKKGEPPVVHNHQGWAN